MDALLWITALTIVGVVIFFAVIIALWLWQGDGPPLF